MLSVNKQYCVKLILEYVKHNFAIMFEIIQLGGISIF